MTKSKIMDKAAIEKAIDSIAKTGKKLDGDIQAAAVGCINHIETCGDVRLFNRLFLAMPKGARKGALTQWALAFGKVEANTGDNKKEQPFIYARTRPPIWPVPSAIRGTTSRPRKRPMKCSTCARR